MWLSRREAYGKKAAGRALTGPVTLPGKELGAWLEGERRGVEVFSPGGYHWSPQIGEELLVLKAGENGERPCAVGVAQSRELSPGEIRIETGKSSVTLTPSGILLRVDDAVIDLDAAGAVLRMGNAAILMSRKGEISVKGNLNVNGTAVGAPFVPPEP